MARFDAQSGASGEDYSQRLWLPPTVFSPGGPNLTIPSTSNPNYRAPVYAFDQTAYEACYHMRLAGLPASWTTFDIKLLWTNHSTGAGDVIWRVLTSFVDVLTPGTLAAPTVTSGSSITVTAPAQDGQLLTTLASGLAITAGRAFRLHVERRGGDAGDTLANDADMLGVMLGKAS